MKEMTNSQLHAVTGGKGLIKAIVGAVIGKKIVAEIKKNLQPNKPKIPTPVKKA